MHEPTDRFAGLRDVPAGLSLSEEDPDDGLLVARIGDLRARINDLTLALGGAEGWLMGWLAREHANGGVLYAAAKINKSRNGPLDTSPSDPRSRSVIMGRFNDWAGEFLARLAEHEAAGSLQSSRRGQWPRRMPGQRVERRLRVMPALACEAGTVSVALARVVSHRVCCQEFLGPG